jgi:hypothetical protein
MALADLATALMGERTPVLIEGRDGPSQDEISRLAYRLYETRGRQDGQDVDDWLSAERALTHASSRDEN